MHAATGDEQCHLPNAVDILAYFRGVRALELAQLRVPFDFEEHLLSRLRRHLPKPTVSSNTPVSPRSGVQDNMG